MAFPVGSSSFNHENSIRAFFDQINDPNIKSLRHLMNVCHAPNEEVLVRRLNEHLSNSENPIKYTLALKKIAHLAEIENKTALFNKILTICNTIHPSFGISSTSTSVKSEMATKEPLFNISSVGREDLSPKDRFEEDRKTIGSKAASQPFLREILREDLWAFCPLNTAIPNDINQQFIQQKFPQYQQLVNSFREVYQKTESLEECESILKQIRSGIKEIYKNEDAPLIEEQKELLIRSIDEDFSLIARSTGMEDTAAVANQGGNKSYPNIPKTIKDLNAATGKVIASYFSLRSLSQRKNSGDDLLAEPFLPVLLQQMVAEKKEIPTSGVMMTRETDLMTEGVMQINATFGHAEGVVSGIESGDLYYVDGDFVSAIVSDEKKTRFAPATESGLALKQNPKELIRQSALTESQLKRLCAIGRKIENAYGCPVDIEWSYIKEEDKFAIFQARPIPETAQLEPSYINPESLEGIENLTYGQVIVGGQANVIRLNSSNTLVVDRALDALELYKKHPKGTIKAVITRHPSHRTSHEAGYLRAQGVVLFQPEQGFFDSLKRSLNDSEFLLDTQEGFTVPIEKDDKIERYVIPGLRRHLAPKMQSAIGDPLDMEKTQAFLNELEILKMNSNKNELESLIRNTKGRNEFDKILNAYENCTHEINKAYLLSKLLLLAQSLIQQAPVSESKLILDKIYKNANYLWSKRSTDDPKQALFAMNWLRAVFLQELPPGIASGSTLRSLLGEKVERTKLSAPLPNISDLEHQEMVDIFNRSSKFIFIPENRALWKTFCSNLDLNQLQELAKIFDILGPNLTESWLNSSFLKAYTFQSSNPTEILNALKQEFENKQNLFAIEICTQMRARANEFQKLSVDFNEPGKFDMLNEQLKTKLLPDALYCLNCLKEASGLGEAMLAAAFDACVEAYDSCIKAVTGSPLYPEDDELKVKRFADMLEGYQLLTKAALSNKVLKDPVLQYEAKWFLPYIDFLYNHLKIKVAKETINFHRQLQSSSAYSAAASQFGNGVMSHERYPIGSLEEFFSTCHQSMKRIAASRYELILKENLPETLQNFCSLLEKINLQISNRPNATPSIQSITYNYPEIEIHFNAPLKIHSAHLTLKATLSIEGKIESMALNSDFFVAYGSGLIRKPNIVLYADQKTKESGLKVSHEESVIMNSDTIHITWKFPGEPFDENLALKGVLILQKIVTFLQMDVPLPDNSDYSLLMNQPHLIELIKQFNVYNNPDLFHSFFIGVNQNPTIENLRYVFNLGMQYKFIYEDPQYEIVIGNLLKATERSDDPEFLLNVFWECMKFFSTKAYSPEQKLQLRHLVLKMIKKVNRTFQLKEILDNYKDLIPFINRDEFFTVFDIGCELIEKEALIYHLEFRYFPEGYREKAIAAFFRGLLKTSFPDSELQYAARQVYLYVNSDNSEFSRLLNQFLSPNYWENDLNKAFSALFICLKYDPESIAADKAQAAEKTFIQNRPHYSTEEKNQLLSLAKFVLNNTTSLIMNGLDLKTVQDDLLRIGVEASLLEKLK